MRSPWKTFTLRSGSKTGKRKQLRPYCALKGQSNNLVSQWALCLNVSFASHSTAPEPSEGTEPRSEASLPQVVVLRISRIHWSSQPRRPLLVPNALCPEPDPQCCYLRQAKVYLLLKLFSKGDRINVHPPPWVLMTNWSILLTKFILEKQ